MTAWRQLRAILAVSLLASALCIPTEANLHRYQSDNEYSFALAEGWAQIPRRELDRMTKMTASAMGMRAVEYEAAFNLATAKESFEYPYLLLQWHSGDTSGAYRKLEEKMSEGMREAKRKLRGQASELLKDIEMGEPVVDREQNRILVQMESEVALVGTIRALLVMRLGARGVAQQNFYAEADDFETYLPQFMQMADSLQFAEGHRYGQRNVLDWIKGNVWIVIVIALVAIALIRKLGGPRQGSQYG